MSVARSGFTRRTFLTTSAAAAGAALLGSPAVALGTTGPLRVAICGLGRRGSELARLCADIPEITVVSVYDPHSGRSQRTAEAHGARSCASLNGALHLADAVVIASPEHVRGAQALEALQMRKPVYIEAPMSLHIEESREIAALAAAQGLAVQVGLSACSDPAWDLVAQLCGAGEVGTLRVAHYHSPVSTRGISGGTSGASESDVDWTAFDPARKRFDAQRYSQWRRFPEYCAGPAAALHLEACALMSKAVGLPPRARVSATGGSFAHQQPQQIDALLSTVEGNNTCSLHLSAAPTAAGQPPVIRGSRGSVKLARRKIVVSMEDGQTREWRVEPPSPSAHLDSWIGAVRGPARCSCPPDLALRAQEITGAALDALAGGTAVTV